MLKGSYFLVLKLKGVSIEVGALGTLNLKPGYYIYVGSAMHSARIKRHFIKKKRARWHIDYLTPIAEEIFAIVIPGRIECILAEKLSGIFDRIKSFGCSDCRCKTHLFYSKSNPEKLLTEIIQKMGLFFIRI
jgi:Uri superfamily endonuclease